MSPEDFGIPPEIIVGPFTYTVVMHPSDFEPQDGTERPKGETRTLIGQCERTVLRIHLAADLAPSMLRVTFVHELLHAIAHIAANESWVNFRRDELEEFVVDNLSPMLVMVLRDNPAIMDYLMGEDLQIAVTPA